MPSAAGKLVDLVAPGYGGEAACSPLVTAGCPTNALTEAFGGTSESAPFVAGAAADVIQAYSDTHGGDAPDAGAGPADPGRHRDATSTPRRASRAPAMVNIYAAVRAAEQEPGTTLRTKDLKTSQGLVSTPTQIDVSGDGGTTVPSQLSVYNASNKATKVTATLKQLGPGHADRPDRDRAGLGAGSEPAGPGRGRDRRRLRSRSTCPPGPTGSTPT